MLKLDPIEIGNGILKNQYISGYASRFALITDSNVALLYGKNLVDFWVSCGLEMELFVFPAGEAHKTRETKKDLEDQLLQKKMGRDTCIIALGGGVVTDMAGYLASTYCRGVPLVIIPTTLLAMVDASIGGKTGVNVPEGKNLIGTIYQPVKVIIDTLMLRTLPKEELACGIVEMIKHGLISDSALFEYLENHSKAILEMDLSILENAILESCRIKKEIVQEDEKERGKRRLLNFGHTIAHALETLSDYKLSHGEAVAIGLLVESYMGVKLGLMEAESFKRLEKVLKLYHLPFKLPFPVSSQAVIEVMALDKKSLDRQPRFAMIQAIGTPLSFEGQYCTPIDVSTIQKALDWMRCDLCCH